MTIMRLVAARMVGYNHTPIVIMRYESCQFGSFDGLDNRRDLLRMFQRMGHGVPDDVAAARRAEFLSGLLKGSTTSLAGKPCVVSPCSPSEAYFEFVALTGVCGVPIEQAAQQLEEAIR